MSLAYGYGYGTPFRGAGGGAWTPASLFAASEAGAWYDPSDLSTLWLDTAGTDPVTADGDPAARTDDKSGNGINALQATSTKRALYRTDGSLHWVEGDGVDDFLNAAAFTSALAQPNTLVFGFKNDLDSNNLSHLFNSQSSNTRHRFYKDDAFVMGTDATTDVVIRDQASHVAALIYNGGASTGRIDGVDKGVSGVGTELLDQLRIFANSAGSDNWVGQLYGLIVVDRALTTEELQSAEAWMAAKSGVTL